MKSPILTVGALERTLDSYNDKVYKQLQQRQETQLEADTWEETARELEQGWVWIDESDQWQGQHHCAILGRTYDLKSAYKQFGLSSRDRDLLRIAVNKPGTEKPVLIGLKALPFGAIGSVAGFLRISLAVWWIGVHGLGIAGSAYFDGYSALTRPELEASTHWSVTSCLNS